MDQKKLQETVRKWAAATRAVGNFRMSLREFEATPPGVVSMEFRIEFAKTTQLVGTLSRELLQLADELGL